ncbi:MAG: N-acetylglucosamine-6-phosphate deacetylase [Rhodospirillales bacterium]|nr:N-acetylglucosamine-6-phosphate deacetylase [Rhodospirillales bacterium]
MNADEPRHRTGAHALRGARIFTGARFLDDHAVLLEGDAVAAVLPSAALPASVPCEVLPGGLLAPGFVDAQVNGGGGVLFNASPDAGALARLAAAHLRCGTTALLPTLITDRPEVMRAALDAVRAALAARTPGIVGVHLEGPFLAPARKGAHDPALIRPLTEEDFALLSGCGIAPLLLTVAAEVVPPAQIARLVQAGVIVSIGHSDADYDTVMAAAEQGARGVTHLFNAMSPLSHRAPGVVGAALDHGGLWGGIIADGHHVHPAALSAALRAKRGPARLFLVSDAMPLAGLADDTFELNGRTVTRRGGALRLADGTLAGSDLTMHAALRHAVRQLGVALDEALRMASLYPARFLGLERHGRIAPGGRADLVHLDDALALRQVWLGGRRIAPATAADGPAVPAAAAGRSRPAPRAD